MRKIRRIALSLVLAAAMLMVFVLPAAAANPTVSITVTAEVVSITNTQSAWAIGNVATTATVYFSATGAQDDNYSQIENTGSVAVDIEIKSSSYNHITTNLAADGTVDWSMKFTAPTAFNANDDGAEKTATVTLVASKHT